jgi:hypothetical protein
MSNGLDTSAERRQVKDGILRALQKLNDKDTVQNGVDEMKEIIQARTLPHAHVPTVCTPSES